MSQVYQCTLYDIHARGFVRPLCVSYLTADPDKALAHFSTLTREFAEVRWPFLLRLSLSLCAPVGASGCLPIVPPSLHRCALSPCRHRASVCLSTLFRLVVCVGHGEADWSVASWQALAILKEMNLDNFLSDLEQRYRDLAYTRSVPTRSHLSLSLSLAACVLFCTHCIRERVWVCASVR
jgi:hypothetical protein